jgi:hypothetical protein
MIFVQKKLRRWRAFQMAKDDPQIMADQFVEGMLKSDLMDCQAAYLSRGRAYGAASDNGLQHRWAEAFRAFVNQRTSVNQLVMDDLMAELGLRGLQPNGKLVEAEMTTIIAEMRRDCEHHPDGHPGVRDAIQNYMKKLDHGMN